MLGQQPCAVALDKMGAVEVQQGLVPERQYLIAECLACGRIEDSVNHCVPVFKQGLHTLAWHSFVT